MPTEVNTLCFHTRDAVEVEDGSFTFEMPLGRLKEDAVKVALASCEFPMVQWTVEEEWCRLWMNEGIRLDQTNNHLDVVFLPEKSTAAKAPTASPSDGEVSPVRRVQLPSRLNGIVSISRKADVLQVECEHEHGLAAIRGLPGTVRLVGDGEGDVVVANADVVPVSPRSFVLKRAGRRVTGARHLVVPTLPSHSHLCASLTAAANAALMDTELRMTFAYDADADRIVTTCVTPLVGAHVRILPSPLARMCGLSTHPFRCGARLTMCPSQETEMWDYVEMPTGFYVPCHRPMCIGQPLRFGSELESAVNRFYFPLGGGGGGGGGASGGDGTHMLVFTHPDGPILTSVVPCGRYSASTLAARLETGMTAAAARHSDDDSPVAYSVYVDESGHFAFSCERKLGRGFVPAVFSILFNHPLCMDGERVGFTSQPAVGGSTYVSPRAVKIVDTNRGGEGERAVSNLIRVGEIASQKRFRMHGVPPPAMTGVFTGRRNGRGAYVQTFLKTSLYAHGFQPGDVVRIAAHPGLEIDEETRIAGTPAVVPAECSCVVADPGTERGEDHDPSILLLELPTLDGLGDANTCVQILSAVEPWNLHFAKARSLPAHMLGFPASAVQWGSDGSIENEEGERIPPFEAPHTHCLDHPDYVLLTFSESSGVGFEHSYSGESRSIFCKLSLYPLFREERMLPRDTTLNQNMSRFTLSFWNPDMKTPYHFHGAQFSFSLNFVSVVPEQQ